MSKTKLCLLLVASTLFNTGCMQEINRSLTKHEAKESYYSGNFARSFRLTEAMAYEGDPKSKYTLGYMYFYGIGAPVNKSLGIAWIKESALDGYPPAILALEKLTYSQIPLVSDNSQPKIITPSPAAQQTIDEPQPELISVKEQNEDVAKISIEPIVNNYNPLPAYREIKTVITPIPVELMRIHEVSTVEVAKDQAEKLEKTEINEILPQKVDLGWMAQVCTFENKGNSSRLIAKLKSNDLPVFTRTFKNNDKDFIVVYIGPFEDKEVLKAHVDNLKMHHQIKDIIVLKNNKDTKEKAIAKKQKQPSLQDNQKEFSLINDFTSLSFL